MLENPNDSLLEMFLFETSENTKQLENIILDTEKSGCFAENSINEIFRIMHTIKGSAAMMSFSSISSIAHKVEDLFFYIRENSQAGYDCVRISDLILTCMDYINNELDEIKCGRVSDEASSAPLVRKIEDELNKVKSVCENKHIKSNFKAVIFFEEDCKMENMRAYSVLFNLHDFADKITYEPADILENADSSKLIRESGFTVYFETEKTYEKVLSALNQTVFLRKLELFEQDFPGKAEKTEKTVQLPAEKNRAEEIATRENHQQAQNIISVNVFKLDKLMDIMGEIVIAEAMVAQNPELKEFEIPNFRKAAAHLRKSIVEMQDMVMSLRLVPLSATFQKMHRIVRDMSKKLNKDVKLCLIGEDTDVDKNIIERISDPLIHLVRNSIDHGIESREDRIKAGKMPFGTVTLEARNAGGDVYIIIKDDGSGLNKEIILEKARKNKLFSKPENELTDKEIYNMILLPGFSTKDTATEYSGRGVGMDVVVQNISAIGGTIAIDSKKGAGTITTLKIPLTIAIIDGMNIGVGESIFTLPTVSIRESFRPKEEDIITDTNGNEMVMVRGECIAVLRLHSQWNIKTEVTNLTDGILIILEQDDKKRCIFADKLIGRQQVVVKALAKYLKDNSSLGFLSGCTLLGDGSISLILDTRWLVSADIIEGERSLSYE